jgi:DNA-binding NarL/FixJ family response regulator
MAAAVSRTLRTVLVDDVADLRDMLRTLLLRDGRFTVVGEGADGSDALRLVGELQPEIVVLDIAMPGVDGITVLPDLRAACPACRIVMLSGYSADEMERRSIERGAVGYIDKADDPTTFPARLHALAAVLDTVQHVLDETYAASLDSPRSARAALKAALETKVDPSAMDVIELLTTELVTNAIRHAHSNARVAASLVGGRIRVSVSDDGPGLPTVKEAAQDDESGRGLSLVETMALDWGIEPLPVGKTVWFETGA